MKDKHLSIGIASRKKISTKKARDHGVKVDAAGGGCVLRWLVVCIVHSRYASPLATTIQTTSQKDTLVKKIASTPTYVLPCFAMLKGTIAQQQKNEHCAPIPKAPL